MLLFVFFKLGVALASFETGVVFGCFLQCYIVFCCSLLKQCCLQLLSELFSVLLNARVVFCFFVAFCGFLLNAMRLSEVFNRFLLFSAPRIALVRPAACHQVWRRFENINIF